jgi:hypothetical protein
MKIILSNVRDNPFPDELKMRRLHNVLGQSKKTIRMIKNEIDNQPWAAAAIYHLISAGIWHAELKNAPLTDLTEVELNEQKES